MSYYDQWSKFISPLVEDPSSGSCTLIFFFTTVMNHGIPMPPVRDFRRLQQHIAMALFQFYRHQALHQLDNSFPIRRTARALLRHMVCLCYSFFLVELLLTTRSLGDRCSSFSLPFLEHPRLFGGVYRHGCFRGQPSPTSRFHEMVSNMCLQSTSSKIFGTSF